MGKAYAPGLRSFRVPFEDRPQRGPLASEPRTSSVGRRESRAWEGHSKARLDFITEGLLFRRKKTSGKDVLQVGAYCSTECRVLWCFSRFMGEDIEAERNSRINNASASSSL